MMFSLDRQPHRDGLTKAIAFSLLAFLVSRAAMLTIGLIARENMQDPAGYVWIYHDWVWLDIWGVWDTGWFLGIIRDGYMSSVSVNPSTPLQANWAFFPLYPMLAAAVSGISGLSPLASLLAVANLSFIAALIWIWVETAEIYGDKAAHCAVALLCVVPGSHVFSSAYSESTFLLLIVGTLAMARKGRWLVAGSFAALAVLTRNLGILLLVPMGIYFLQQEIVRSPARRNRLACLFATVANRRFAAFAATAFLPVLALAAFMVFLHFRVGDALAFLTIQKAWGRAAQWPFLALFHPFYDPFRFPQQLWPSVFAGWAASGLCLVLVLKRQWAHAAFSIVFLTILLTAGILSVFRLILPVAPLFMIAGSLLAGWPRIAFALLAVLAIAEACLMWGWAVGWPVY